jgi:hypothetical protein
MMYRMTSTSFDPIAVERKKVEERVLPARADSAVGPLAELEHHFTEYDPRKYALWRTSMVRQFQPSVVKQLSGDDLLFLAGQSPEGYTGDVAFGVRLDKNKIAQNALRARVELDTRATRGAWVRNVVLSVVSLVIGAVLASVLSWIDL